MLAPTTTALCAMQGAPAMAWVLSVPCFLCTPLVPVPASQFKCAEQQPSRLEASGLWQAGRGALLWILST